MTRTLREVLPTEAMGDAYGDAPAMKHLDQIVVAERLGNWPGRHKFVHVWYVLKNGYAVGWNENTTRGWSFPVIRYDYRGDRHARG